RSHRSRMNEAITNSTIAATILAAPTMNNRLRTCAENARRRSSSRRRRRSRSDAKLSASIAVICLPPSPRTRGEGLGEGVNASHHPELLPQNPFQKKRQQNSPEQQRRIPDLMAIFQNARHAFDPECVGHEINLIQLKD